MPRCRRLTTVQTTDDDEDHRQQCSQQRWDTDNRQGSQQLCFIVWSDNNTDNDAAMQTMDNNADNNTADNNADNNIDANNADNNTASPPFSSDMAMVTST